MSSSKFGRYVLNAVTAGIMGSAVGIIKTEVERAKNEIQAKLKALGVGAAFIAIASGLLSLAFILLLVAGLIALTYVWPAWLVALVGGGALLVIGLIFLAVGSSKIKNNKDLMPQSAINNIKAVFNK